MYLYYVGNNPEEISDRFNRAQGEIMDTIIGAAKVFNLLYIKWVKWPDSVQKQQIKNDFKNKCGFENVVTKLTNKVTSFVFDVIF